MRYFKNLQDIKYLNSNSKNIMQRIFLELSEEDILYYDISTGKKDLYSISFDLYDSEEYWWVIALINDIHDIIWDMPILDDAAFEIVSDSNNWKYFNAEDENTCFQAIMDYNNTKKRLKVVNKTVMRRIYIEIIRTFA